MSEPFLTDELPFDLEERYLAFNLSLQKAMLLLVEHCHCSDYQATLNCSLAELENSLNKGSASKAFIASMKRVLTTVLAACYDVSQERTLEKMRTSFSVMDASLTSEHEARRRQKG